MPTISDYLQSVPTPGGAVVAKNNQFVQLVANDGSGLTYTSGGTTDAAGKWTIANVPPGSYTVNFGPTGGGPWTPANDLNYMVPDVWQSQSIAFATPLPAVDAGAGKSVFVGLLTGNTTLPAPLNPRLGQELEYFFQQDGTGGRTVGPNGVFLDFPGVFGGKNARTAVRVRYDGASWRTVSQLPQLGILTSRVLPTGQLTAKPLGEGSPGLFDWVMDDTVGYLLHFTTGPNAGPPAACIGIGVDNGAQGLLINNKNNGAGFYLQQSATVVGSTSWGMYGRQFSSAAALIHLDQNNNTDAPLLSLWGAPGVSPRILEVFKDAGTTLAGYINGVGELLWSQHVRFIGPVPTLGALQTGVNSQSIAGTDMAAFFSVTTTGAPPGANAQIAIINFGGPSWGVAPIPAYTNQSGNQRVYGFVSATASNVQIGDALTGATTYNFGALHFGRG